MRAIARVLPADWLAGWAGAALIGCLWLEWYGGDSGIICVRAPCGGLVAQTGWEALARADLGLVVAGAVGLLVPLAAVVRGRGRLLAGTAALALLAGLGAAALATYLWARGAGDPASGPATFSFPLIGAFVAPLAGFGVAAASWWGLRRRAAFGPRSKRAADAGRLCVLVGAVAMVASLSLPWFETASGGLGGGPPSLAPFEPPRGRVTGFEAFRISDALLVVLAVATGGCALRGLARDRLTPDLAATLAAGSALAGVLVSVTRPALILFGGEFAREYGVVVATAGAALALLGGTWASLRRGGDSRPRGPRSSAAEARVHRLVSALAA